jgi:hypothetical protein
MVLHYVIALVEEIRRINGLPIQHTGEDARMIDRYGGEITAYLNGRIHQLLEGKPCYGWGCKR